MRQYKRLFIPNGTYFFTVVTYKRKKILCEPHSIERLVKAFKHVQQQYPYKTLALVILPDHFHCLWELPKNDSNYSLRLSLIKKFYSASISQEPDKRGYKKIWQHRFWEHAIRSEHDLQKHLDYIYFNPVKHGYALSPREWKYSTFMRDVQNGLYDVSWASHYEPMGIRVVCKE